MENCRSGHVAPTRFELRTANKDTIVEISLTTPAILFPAVSLLMLAYTNRFLAIANIIRTLHARYNQEGTVAVRRQIENLRCRLGLIRHMQAFGILSLIACMCSVVALFVSLQVFGQVFFGASLVLMLLSLLFCLREIYLSGRALEIELEDMQSN
jgi:hypothetical protein